MSLKTGLSSIKFSRRMSSFAGLKESSKYLEKFDVIYFMDRTPLILNGIGFSPCSPPPRGGAPDLLPPGPGGSFQISKSWKSPPRSPPGPQILAKTPPRSGGEQILGRAPSAPKNDRFPYSNTQKAEKFFAPSAREGF